MFSCGPETLVAHMLLIPLKSYKIEMAMGCGDHVAMWLCSKITKFQNFKKVLCIYSRKTISCFQVDILRYSQTIISCFQADIGPIFKIFKKSLDGSSSFFGACLFGTCQLVGLSKSWDMKNNMFRRCFHDFPCIFWSIFGIVKWVNTGFQGLENPEIMEMSSFDA